MSFRDYICFLFRKNGLDFHFRGRFRPKKLLFYKYSHVAYQMKAVYEQNIIRALIMV